MKKEYPRLLKIISDGNFHSGEALAVKLGVSRAAIWKSIKSLQKNGLEVSAIPGKGYCLDNKFEPLLANEIQSMISRRAQKCCKDINVVLEIKSTNSYFLDQLNQKKLIHGSVLLAEYQSDGRGRRNKKWLSPITSGICFSLGWRFEVMPINLGLLSLYMGLAIARALKSLGLKGIGLKWPNDVLVMNHKIGGILLDIRGESAGPLDVVIGVGVNYKLPKKEIVNIDQSIIDISNASKKYLSRNMIAASLISNIFEILNDLVIGSNSNLIKEWREYDCFFDQEAKLILANEEITGTLKGINDQGALLISVNGRLLSYNSGEVSLRI